MKVNIIKKSYHGNIGKSLLNFLTGGRMISSESSSSFCEFPPFSPFCELTKVFSEAGLAVVSETTEPGEELAGRLFWNRKARNELILSLHNILHKILKIHSFTPKILQHRRFLYQSHCLEKRHHTSAILFCFNDPSVVLLSL